MWLPCRWTVRMAGIFNKKPGRASKRLLSSMRVFNFRQKVREYGIDCTWSLLLVRARNRRFFIRPMSTGSLSRQLYFRERSFTLGHLKIWRRINVSVIHWSHHSIYDSLVITVHSVPNHVSFTFLPLLAKCYLHHIWRCCPNETR